jgi:hypothetical protein
MTRRLTGGIALALLAVLAVFDVATSEFDPYAAPPMLAFGSGQAVSGAHCAALPE